MNGLDLFFEGSCRVGQGWSQKKLNSVGYKGMEGFVGFDDKNAINRID